MRPFPHPDVMLTYGSKDSLVKVATTDAGLEDTHAYATMEALQQQVGRHAFSPSFGGHSVMPCNAMRCEP